MSKIKDTLKRMNNKERLGAGLMTIGTVGLIVSLIGMIIG